MQTDQFNVFKIPFFGSSRKTISVPGTELHGRSWADVLMFHVEPWDNKFHGSVVLIMFEIQFSVKCLTKLAIKGKKQISPVSRVNLLIRKTVQKRSVSD
jgi:hypothetical protein